MTSESGNWPLLEERAPYAAVTGARRSRRAPRSAWVLTGLAFICGGLVSAAAFSIGWRHQAQRDTAARTALAAATARTQQLEHRIAALQASSAEAHRTAGAATSAEGALARAGARVAADATSAHAGGASVSSGAGSLSTAAIRISSELKTLDTYLATTPAGQLDPGYVASQAAYLARQLMRLQDEGGTLGNSVASLDSSLRKLARDANGLLRR